MKYSIEGFNQPEALKFRKEIIENGKSKTIKIDCIDLVILRWLVDFYPEMMKVEINGQQYVWVNYKKILNDIPLLDIKKQMLALRLKKMVEFGILKSYTIKQGGTFSYYGFGDNYIKLIKKVDTTVNNEDEDTIINYNRVYNKLDTHSKNIIEQINSSIKDKSIRDNIYDEFEDIWNKYPRKLGKDNALKAYIKARRSGVERETIEQGVENYVDYIKENRVEEKYIKHGSTWFNQQGWNDVYKKKKKNSNASYDIEELMKIE